MFPGDHALDNTTINGAPHGRSLVGGNTVKEDIWADPPGAKAPYPVHNITGVFGSVSECSTKLLSQFMQLFQHLVVEFSNGHL